MHTGRPLLDMPLQDSRDAGGKGAVPGKVGVEGLTGVAHCIFYLVLWYLFGSC